MNVSLNAVRLGRLMGWSLDLQNLTSVGQAADKMQILELCVSVSLLAQYMPLMSSLTSTPSIPQTG